MSTKPLTQRRSRELGALYTEHHATLQRHIAHRVHAPWALIEDACQAAWAKLAAREDIAIATDRARGWLYTVAVREAWALVGDRQLTDSLPHWLGQADDDVPAEALARIADLDRLAQLAELKARRARSADPPGRRPQLSADRPGHRRLLHLSQPPHRRRTRAPTPQPARDGARTRALRLDRA